MKVEFTQYLMPDGRKRMVHTNIADDLEPQVTAIMGCGLRLTAEMLPSGEIAIYITDVDDDYAIKVVPNGPEVPKAVDKMIRSFDKSKYLKWREGVMANEQA